MMLVGAFHAVVWWDREGFWKWIREAKITNDFKMAFANPASTVAADRNAVHFFIIILQRWRCLAKSGLKEMQYGDRGFLQ
ncbi:hypothetical protein [Pseudogulbenkiania subflava]|uniref:hypothetical protein n=1 Tax=Pseudogulbenkiania subflava TaxID=451637 RepID=UPI00117B82DC|nr:hypothetical protein [Pseudogulbenkiania subflava]